MMNLLIVLPLIGAMAFARQSAQIMTPSQQSVLQTCALELCGSPEQYLPFSAKGPYQTIVPETEKAFLKNEIEPLLIRLIDAHVEEMKLKHQYIEPLIQRAQHEGLSKEQEAFLKAGAIISRISKKMKDIVDPSDTGSIIVTVDKLKTIFPIFRAPYGQQTAELLTSLVSSLIESADSHRFTFDLWFQGSNPDSSISPMEQTLARIKDYLFTKKEMDQEFGGQFVLDQVNEAILQKLVLQNLEASAVDKQLAMDAISELRSFFPFTLARNRELALKIPITPIQALNIANWPTRKAVIQSRIFNSGNLVKLKETTLKFCKDQIVGVLATTPSTLQLRKAKDMLQQVRLASMTVAQKYFSDDELKSAIEAIEQADFRLPNEEAENFMRDYLSAKYAFLAKQKEKRISKLKTILSNGNSSEWRSFLLSALISNEEDAEGNFLKSLRHSCEHIKAEAPIDALIFTGSKYAILTSWQTVRFPDYGRSTMAHEIAHEIFRSFENPNNAKKFQNVVACSFEMHSDLEPAGLSNSAYKRFSEEDWADLFGNEVEKLLGSNSSAKQNSICFMLELDQTNNQFKNLSFLADAWDSHSSTLLRALQSHIVLGQPVPKSCAEALGPDPKRRQWAQRSCVQ